MPCIYLNYNKNVPVPSQIQIGVGSDNVTDTPLDGLYDYSQAGIIYSASQLSAISGKQITAIEFYYNNWNSGYTVNNQVIKMGHCISGGFPTSIQTTYAGFLVDSLTTVKNTFTFFNIGSGGPWKKNDFDTYFTYNGTNDLLISWENYDGTWSSGYGWLEGTSKSNRYVANWWKDGSYPTGTANQTQFLQPNIIIHYQ